MQDKVLVNRILKGDKAAGERLVTTHYPHIFRMLRCLTGSAETAQDLTQQTFTQAWQALASYQGRAQLTTWLHRIAYHEYTHWLRARRDHLPLEAVADIEDLRAVQGLDSIVVSRAMAQLSIELRETFLLYYIQDLAVAEVAEILDLPSGTVKSRLFAARQRMRELLQAADAPPASPVVGVQRPLVSGLSGVSRIEASRIEGGHAR